jgi:hypothetical protein
LLHPHIPAVREFQDHWLCKIWYVFEVTALDLVRVLDAIIRDTTSWPESI